MIERWELIHLNGHNTGYYVSTFGNIKTDDSNPVKFVLKKDIMGDNIVKYYCNIPLGPKKCTIPVDKIVATTFLKRERNLNIIKHLDSNVLNNNIENLRWV